jgi:hypothetical protein
LPTRSPIAEWTVAKKQGVCFLATRIVGFFAKKQGVFFHATNTVGFFCGESTLILLEPLFSSKIKGSSEREDSKHPPPPSSVRHICLPTVPDDAGGGGGLSKTRDPTQDLVAIKIEVIESNVNTHFSFSVNNS